MTCWQNTVHKISLLKYFSRNICRQSESWLLTFIGLQSTFILITEDIDYWPNISEIMPSALFFTAFLILIPKTAWWKLKYSIWDSRVIINNNCANFSRSQTELFCGNYYYDEGFITIVMKKGLYKRSEIYGKVIVIILP